MIKNQEELKELASRHPDCRMAHLMGLQLKESVADLRSVEAEIVAFEDYKEQNAVHDKPCQDIKRQGKRIKELVSRQRDYYKQVAKYLKAPDARPGEMTDAIRPIFNEFARDARSQKTAVKKILEARRALSVLGVKYAQ